MASTLVEIVSPLLQSPRKRRRQEASSTNGEVVLCAVAQLHAEVALPSGDAFGLHAHVLRVPEESRWLTMMNTRAKQAANVPVLNIFLGDATVVITLQLCREAAMRFGSVFIRLSAASENSAPPLVRIERFLLKAEDRKCLSPIRKLDASDKMSIQPVNASMHALAPFAPCGLYRALLVSGLFRLHGALPFIANIRGHTTECEEVRGTRGGVGMRCLRVVDAVGCYVP